VAETSEDYGAVAVRGVVTYDLVGRDAEHLELRNVQEPEQYILIHIEALHGVVSILNKAAQRVSSRPE
jgi:hypothetical protein